ncbi:histidinol dehydrogenase [Bacillus coahuilensis m2-6]|uniref:Histidinol dehydrogenase n=1 Tax=Bacillus coahuilensis p1.1.43 TaxID=1150625 RepID=A0A147K5V6_9BACI|nr:histidinol dehydrogenase [Bacillus coahuilensis]KUP05207.1 histidinol dehydrogenase [Bacillus coahuilensis p1.1.43]KUP05658.1 histidinol dehydrogenase [Bacillus coahuilensis m2-6]
MKIIKSKQALSLKRTVESGTDEQQRVVEEILQGVKERKDEALLDYTERFDGVRLSRLIVTGEELDQAYDTFDPELRDILEEAARNITSFHEEQKRQSWFKTTPDGSVLGQKIQPIESVGVYVPGGTAAYPSSVFMNVIPAKVAGVKRIVMVSPPNENGDLPDGVLVAAKIAGVTEIYKVGGAQGIGALAYGTETIEPVDKITGPGNIYVALAKRAVYGDVDIDMIAGPSEIVVLADDTAVASEVAADLLSQAEHDTRACSILVTTSEKLAFRVQEEVESQLTRLPRESIARKAIRDHGAIYVVTSIEEGVDVIDELAPEHLEVMTEDAFSVAMKVRNAGAIFIGRYSSEPVGDYFAGPNHVLPTNGTARFSSPLNVDDFVKKSSIIQYSEKALKDHYQKIAAFARLEGLEAHARAVESRFREDGE